MGRGGTFFLRRYSQGIRVWRARWRQKKERPQCARKLSDTDWTAHYRAGIIAVALAIPSHGYAEGSPETAGPSFSQIKNFFDPVSRVLAAIAYGGIVAWEYVISHPPAAVLLSALVASTVAVVSIKKNRETTKLRETFAKISAANWDKDFIKARQIF